MTAKELVEAAQKCDPSKEVKFCVLLDATHPLGQGQVCTGRLAILDEQDALTLFGVAKSGGERDRPSGE